MIAPTAAPAVSTLANEAIATCASCGFGVSFTVTSVTIPSSPSEPIMSESKS